MNHSKLVSDVDHRHLSVIETFPGEHMKLKPFAFAGVAMGLSALLMIATAPFTGANVGAVSVMLDRTFGEGWAIVPMLHAWGPILIVWGFYTICIGLGMYYLLYMSDQSISTHLDKSKEQE